MQVQDTARPDFAGWLDSRQLLLRELIDLSSDVDAEEVELFSHDVLDYIARGHLRVYPTLLSSADERIAAIYTQLTETTEALLSFTEAQQATHALPSREGLSCVGMTLAEHFELEDELLRCGGSRRTFDA